MKNALVLNQYERFMHYSVHYLQNIYAKFAAKTAAILPKIIKTLIIIFNYLTVIIKN